MWSCEKGQPGSSSTVRLVAALFYLGKHSGIERLAGRGLASRCVKSVDRKIVKGGDICVDEKVGTQKKF